MMRNPLALRAHVATPNVQPVKHVSQAKHPQTSPLDAPMPSLEKLKSFSLNRLVLTLLVVWFIIWVWEGNPAEHASTSVGPAPHPLALLT